MAITFAIELFLMASVLDGSRGEALASYKNTP